MPPKKNSLAAKAFKKLKPDSAQTIKNRIQALLRKNAIARDGGCVLRIFPEAGQCGGYRNDGELILQAEHLNSRAHSVSYGDMRNIVCLCQRHHGFWKPQNSRLYWELIRRVIGEDRWEWLKKVEADRKAYRMGVWEWGKIELGLKQELQGVTCTNGLRHDFRPLSPQDPIRGECQECSRVEEMNPYTREKKVLSQEDAEYYRQFFSKSN